MSYRFVPTLQSMAADKIVSHLWNRADVIDLLAETRTLLQEEWLKVGKKVLQKVGQLPLPKDLRKKTLGTIVRPIGDLIWEWMFTHVILYQFESTPREFRWTPLGTVDKKGTAEAFVRDPTLPEGDRYWMACLYCLEWDSPVPFPPPQPNASGNVLRQFEAYWTYDRTGDVTPLLYKEIERYPSKSPYRLAFEEAVTYSNEVAAECYLNKLSAEERNRSLSDDLITRTSGFGVYRLLLLQMDEGQRSRLLETRAEDVLECLLERPWQQFFTDVARRVRDVLDKEECFLLLARITRKIRDGYGDYGYGELLGELWAQIPPDRKKEVMRDGDRLSELLRGLDEKNVSEGSPEEREQTLFSDGFVGTCAYLARHEMWDSLELFVFHCLSTREKLIHFREECEERTDDFGDAYFRFLDELIERMQRRQWWRQLFRSVAERTLQYVCRIRRQQK